MALNFGEIDFEWNERASTIIKNLGFGKELNKEAAQILYEHYYKYVPYKDGNLSNNVRVSATDDHGTITHLVKYANKQYYGNSFERERRFHPLATSFWDQYCWMNEGYEITEEIDEARKLISAERRL